MLQTHAQSMESPGFATKEFKYIIFSAWALGASGLII
jgi:hypothetical protein